MDIISSHNSIVLALTETRMADRESLLHLLPFTNIIQVLVSEYSGEYHYSGSNELIINQKVLTEQKIYVSPQVSLNFTPWYFTIIYAQNNYFYTKKLYGRT